jgi:hypothetical protein
METSMHTLAFIHGFNPARFLFFSCPLAGVIFLGGIIWLIVWSSRRGPSGPGASPTYSFGPAPLNPIDADIDRRRRLAEVERMELENAERRQRMSGGGAPPAP